MTLPPDSYGVAAPLCVGSGTKTAAYRIQQHHGGHARRSSKTHVVTCLRAQAFVKTSPICLVHIGSSQNFYCVCYETPSFMSLPDRMEYRSRFEGGGLSGNEGLPGPAHAVLPGTAMPRGHRRPKQVKSFRRCRGQALLLPAGCNRDRAAPTSVVAIPRPPELLVALHGDGHRSKTCRGTNGKCA